LEIVVKERIVAIGLLTQQQVDRFGSSLEHVWPVEDAPHFTELLDAIDEADRTMSRVGEESGST